MRRLLFSLFLLSCAGVAWAQSDMLLSYRSSPTATTNVSTTNPLPTTVLNAADIQIGSVYVLVPAPTTSYNVVATNTFSYAPVADKQLIYAHVVYAANATVGNRAIVLQLINGSAQVVGDWHTSAYITAGQTGRHVEFLPGTYREAAFDAVNTIQTPFPVGLIVPNGYTLKIFDANNVSASDSMVVGYQVR